MRAAIWCHLHEEPISGYHHPLYVRALAEFGEPRELPCSQGWLLERSVPGGVERDAMGCYPLFCVSHWSGLSKDLADIGPSLVSVALVTDPFGAYLPDELRMSFDKVVAFKEHHVVDFAKPLLISRHHRYYSRKAGAEVKVEAGPPPDGFAEQWSSLYASLAQRHGLRGIKAFSTTSFDLQMKVPGMVVFRGTEDGVLVGAHLWYVQGDVAYSHLAASTERGYELNCSYAIHSAVLEHFRSHVRCVDLGAGAGTSENQDGLTKFKAGWANGARTAYFCGRILNPERYAALAREMCVTETNYFPAYRRGELA